MDFNFGDDPDRGSSAHIARRTAVLGPLVASFSFLVGSFGAEYIQLYSSGYGESALEFSKGMFLKNECNDAMRPDEACFSLRDERYLWEWRLFEDVEFLPDIFPDAVNQNEVDIHNQRFDGIERNVEEMASKQKATPHTGARMNNDDTQFLKGEGGRRLERSSYFEDLPREEHNHQKITSIDDMISGTSEETKAAEALSEKIRQFKLDELEQYYSLGAFRVKVYNDYTADKASPYNMQYPWFYIAEPYRNTTLEVVNASPGAAYRWHIGEDLLGHGPIISTTLTKLGYHDLFVEERVPAVQEGAQSVVNRLKVRIMVKYVRRELRHMADLDREAWLSAVMVMQRVPTIVGQSLYGPHYFSKDHFARMHLYYGGTKDCDHWHEGAGFVVSHIALTLVFEKCLQSINPSISTPYWDFTLESTFYGANDWRSSILFSPDWFGAASPDNDLHTVMQGRFAFVPTLMDSRKYSKWTNSYGLMRGPWNNDPTPFLTRSIEVYGVRNNQKPSGCEEYVGSLQKTTWMAMSIQLNTNAHGHIHELIGGSWHHDYALGMNRTMPITVFQFAHEIQGLSKMLWRTNVVTCPEMCDMTVAAADCKCSCDAGALQGRRASDVLHSAGILSSANFFDFDYNPLDHTNFLDEDGNVQDPIPGYDEETSGRIYDHMLHVLCDPGHIGDMYQGTSTNDITFWVIHSTVDRLWHFKRLGNPSNYDETWDPFHTCYGHNPQNFQPFSHLFEIGTTTSREATMNEATEIKSELRPRYTNIDLYADLNPAYPSLPYIYEHFEWPHCERLGYKMLNTW